MQLPIQSAPEYRVELPVSKQTVKFRPFLVKEQRNMIMVKEDATPTEMYYALINMLQSVCISDLEIDQLPMTDVEYMFMNVRARSVGETQDVKAPCREKDCDGTVNFKVDMTNLKINEPKIRVDDKGKIELNDELTVQLKVPTSKQMMTVADIDNESDMIRKLCLISLEKIYDKENIYDLKEYRDSEIIDFIESLTIEQFTLISRFFEEVPTVSLEMDGVCEKCGAKSKDTLQGFANFF
tara:strand:- start:2647 stop:3363 length:717 start_codon:yes stop_codon:yes gene_type:complete